ncbi:PREDICTED: protein CHLOROPLAST IMPORT APPARATUS 2 [Tarenaya hassleriana]|uniref:protein CHLOROPLAST IMPORT APPARATUS 2 n=1 Tax=Tarenaya hassleriana TaxID=28532 RepID=UPI00053C9B82|nr:PREDICTED: protein CHLOROPLAST IMPORT APPARATUS 2 [Tarenaya hassleriana]
MSSCLSGGGGRAAAYGFDLEIVKSPPSTSTTSRATSHNTPSPSSTLSESNSPLAISTRKPRTPRKRPNQTYNEAAMLLSTAYPNIFSSDAKKSPSNSQFFGIKSPCSDFDETSELLLPFESIEEPDILFHPPLPVKTGMFFKQKEMNFEGKSSRGGEIDGSWVNRLEIFDDFDAESILDEEVEEGIDSIMGSVESKEANHEIGRLGQMMMNPWYGSSTGFGFAGKLQLGLGLRSTLRDNDDANWWRFPTVDFDQISPRMQSAPTTAAPAGKAKSDNKKKTVAMAAEKNKKKKKKKVSPPAESKSCESGKEDREWNPNPEERSGLLLKLDYDGVLEAWSDKASPFSDEILVPDSAGADGVNGTHHHAINASGAASVGAAK